MIETNPPSIIIVKTIKECTTQVCDSTFPSIYFVQQDQHVSHVTGATN